MLVTLSLATLFFLAQVGAYIMITRALRNRATFKRRTRVLYVSPPVIRPIVPHAHNRPGDN